MARFRLLCAVVLAGCAPAPPSSSPLGVEVFADDTVPVLFALEQTGSIQIAINAAETLVQPDRSVLFRTPATLMVRKGDGTSVIRSRTAGRLAVQPAGTSPDSAEQAAVVGSSVRLVRAPNARQLLIERVSP